MLRRFASALAVFALVAVCSAAFVLAPTPAQGRSTGANPGFAGNFENAGTPQTCAVSGCHNSFALNSGTGSVALDAPTTATAGETVTLTVTVDNQTAPDPERRQGFQATIRDASGDVHGELVVTDAANTKFSSATGAYITHSNAGQTQWSFDWTVGDDTGIVTIYVAGNAANGNGGTSGDHIYAVTADVEVLPVDGEAGPELAFSVSSPRPHPARVGQRVAFDLDLDRPGTATVRLVDGQGRTVRVLADGERRAGQVTLALDTADLAPGTYFVAVDGPGGRRIQPLAVVR